MPTPAAAVSSVPPIASRSAINPRQILPASELTALNRRSNLQGAARLGGHLAVLGASGYLWRQAPLPVALPALVLYGCSLALMFCAMHECCHRTAFASNRLNDAIAWVAGLLSGYNSTFYRRYHKWHHRFTQMPGKDPELDDPKPESWPQYLWQISGIPWWIGKLRGHSRVAMGQLSSCYFLPETAQAEVVHSTRLQLGLYGAIFMLSAALGHPGFIVTYWLLPLAIGQPLLRFVLLAEHSGCTQVDNPLTNTRTTLTLRPLGFLMWNMPYHAEHHLYPSMPFHALPQAHAKLRSHFAQVDRGYISVNRSIVAAFQQGA
ncbi:MAG: fatty acid desaturase [Elainellaceae cyanobacterium]